MNKAISETALYAPVAAYLAEQGYTVRGEVKNCDVVALRGDEVVAVELKRAINFEVVLQAVERQKLADAVYVAAFKPAGKRGKTRWRAKRDVLQRLGLGLLLVDFARDTPTVELALTPLGATTPRRNKKRRALVDEAQRRSLDLSIGGSTRREIMTAYRENALHVVFWLRERGAMSARELVALGTHAKTHSTLYRDVYGYFRRLRRGVYELSEQGRGALDAYPELVALWTRE